MALVVDPRGNWEIKQRRPGGRPEDDVAVRISVVRSGLAKGAGTFDGSALWDGRRGELGGEVKGATIRFTIKWPDGLVGEYRGYWFADGYLRGHSQSATNPASTAEWWSAENRFRQVDL